MSYRGPGRLLRLLVGAGGLALVGLGMLAISDTPRSGATASAPPQPVLGRSETLSLLAGIVSVRVKGTTTFTRLSGSITVPDESEVETGQGRVQIIVATLEPGQTAAADAYQGRFLLHQDAAAPATTHLTLSQTLSGCVAPMSAHRASATRARAARRSRHGSKSRHLWVSDSGGNWGTNGRYVSTTVEGTRWLTFDECRASKVKVLEGIVLVHDLVHHSKATVTAGHEYVATQPPVEGPGFVPPAGEVLSGETGVSPAAFQQQVGKHVAVFGFFGSWGGEFGSLLSYVRSLRSRLLLHLSTDVGYGASAGEEVTPAQIARGQSDGYLVKLCKELASSAAPVYLALLPEMNQANNAYSAFNPNGSSRGPANSTGAFRQAWRRVVLIIRGGAIHAIDKRLHALGLPSLGIPIAVLPRPKVSFMWAPQTAGTPDTPANSPAAYYPGGAYVDIVGTDFYSAFPNFAGLQSLYAAYSSKPFGFNEWAMWKNGDPGFVRQLFGFVRSHRRVALMAYNEGLSPTGPFRLERFPAATAELRRQLRSPRLLGYPPE